MSLFSRTMYKWLGAIAIGLAVFGCGSASNNDQGVSFLFLGFFDPDSADETTGIVGISAPLSDIIDPETEEQISGALRARLLVQNNLSGEFIRTQRAFLDFNVDGASAQPPSSSSLFSTIIGPGESGLGGSGSSSSSGEGEGSTLGGGSSLPPSAGEISNRAFGTIPLVPPDVRSWLSLNRNDLPEPPFIMEVTVYITGLTSSGNRLDTNTMSIFVQVTPDAIVPPAGSEEEEAA